MALADTDAASMGECLRSGGVVVFPTDTVYGLGCDPDNEQAVTQLYELKDRQADRPAAVMFFDRGRAIRALPELGARERAAIEALLPGPVTLLLPNPRGRFPLASGGGAGGPGALGLRVPLLGDSLAALGAVSGPIMQSSANLSGEIEARRLTDVPRSLLDGADLLLDGGELPGLVSTVLDLRDYQRTGRWSVVREGALELGAVERALA